MPGARRQRHAVAPAARLAGQGALSRRPNPVRRQARVKKRAASARVWRAPRPPAQGVQQHPERARRQPPASTAAVKPVQGIAVPRRQQAAGLWQPAVSKAQAVPAQARPVCSPRTPEAFADGSHEMSGRIARAQNRRLRRPERRQRATRDCPCVRWKAGQGQVRSPHPHYPRRLASRRQRAQGAARPLAAPRYPQHRHRAPAGVVACAGRRRRAGSPWRKSPRPAWRDRAPGNRILWPRWG